MAFKPGQSGNPAGRGKGKIELGAYLRSWLKDHDMSSSVNRTNLERIIENLAEQDPKQILYFAFGKPVDHHEVNVTETVRGLPEDMLNRIRQYAREEAARGLVTVN